MRLPRSLVCMGLFLGLTAGCGESSEDPVEQTLGGLTVRVDSDPAKITVTAPDGRIIFDGLPGGEAGEKYEAPNVAGATRWTITDWRFEVGSFRIEETLVDPWSGVTKFVNLAPTADAITFDLRGKGGENLGTGSVAAGADGEVAITMEMTKDEVNRASIAFACNPGEHFLGFGGQTADVDHRGETIPLWVQEDGIGKVDTDDYRDGIWILQGRKHSTHTPMPMYVSSHGYALMLETPYRSIFNMCSEADDTIRVEAWEPNIRLRVFDGPSASQALQRMTARVGRPELPPKFAFAPWLDAIYGEDNVRRVANALRDANIPYSAIWTEDWRGGNDEGTGYVLEEDWTVDRDIYPNFETLAGDLHDLGVKFLIYNNTFLDESVPEFAEANNAGYSIKDDTGAPYIFTGVKFRDSTMVDLSNPDAVAWTKSKYRAGLALGTDGYMADFAEWLPHDAVLHSGEDAKAAHNMYPVQFQKLNKELFDEMHAEDGVDRLFFVRSAYLGSQPLVSVVWAGDQQTDFSKPDGYPSVIPMGIGLGMTGFPYYGHDIAGYMSQTTVTVTKELWFRWVTFGALSPVMRTHHGRDARNNWNWESDAESTAHMQRWATLHQRLFPYLYGLAKTSSETGRPMFAPLALAYPDFEPGWTSMDQYMLGDRIIVAPVVEEGAVSRVVDLPGGTFYPLLGGAAIVIPDGGGQTTIDAPVSEIPALVPAGTVLVLLPDGVQTTEAVAQGTGIMTLADAADDRELWVWPGGDSTWEEAGGLSYEWTGTALTGAATTASFEGSDAPIMSDADGDYVDVVGPGTLTVNGSATLVITGGATDRAIRVRFR